MKLFASSLLVLLLGIGNASAAESAYTKINFEKTCVFHSEYEQGASAYCSGYKGYPVHFDEGDLRQMVRFGHVASLNNQWESFGQFNRINDTIEWRLRNGKPFATILRWFIENPDSDGVPSKKVEGQVLVVSKVADHENPTSCVVGYVDARANKGANVLARKLADERAESFICASDKPQIIGKKGRYFGNPVNSFN